MYITASIRDNHNELCRSQLGAFWDKHNATIQRLECANEHMIWIKFADTLDQTNNGDHIDTNDNHGITLIDVCHKLVCKVLQTHIDGSWISTNSSPPIMIDFKPNKCVVQMQHTQFPWLQHFDSKLPIDMMLHEQQIRRVQHYKYLDVVLHEPLYHTMRLDYNQVAVCNSMLVVSDSCKPSTHNQLSDTNILGSQSINDHFRSPSVRSLVAPM
ncbi:hypothetical protein BDEG_23218 [Batrachochytrium dendrobatidis JEL423]|uniref:Uncharacterized protein n=1 Tax=Batrachochytrium dendrobatidis (strain JEL423) TaxID=403673 RepID=A0A177WI12_BATDL|nr:hypothetical protein BDEG_23218 [Batrachochytrium dendrobatidis JEL423]